MFLRYAEKIALDEGMITEEDIQKFVKDHCLGFSTAHKLMEVLVPQRRRRLQCIDNYQADSIDAFDFLDSYTKELALMSKIDAATRTDLLRRTRVSSNFVAYNQRVHMEKESDTINHCLRYLLSDPNKKEFASPCNRGCSSHSHELVCTDCLECMEVFDIFLDILRNAHSESVANNENTESKKNVEDYRRHQIRAFASELDRKEIIESLQPKEALVISDFALKLIPTKTVEKQSAWYAKAGIAYHMSYCVANLNGELYHHSFGHAADDLKQDSIATSAITEHVLRELKENGVDRVYLRSDNAGNYRNAAYLSTLYHLQKEVDIKVLGYVFSEAQSGKGAADREIGQSKGKIRDSVDAKGNASNAKEVVEALCAGTWLKATSVHEIIVEESPPSGASFPGITSFGSFRFEKEGIRARKFDNIGDGILFEKKKIIKNKYTYSFGLEGGFRSKSAGFWRKFHCDEDKEVEMEETTEEDPQRPMKEGIFSCSDRLCISTFTTLSGLRKHELFGKHKRRKNTESTIDTGVRMFAEAIETDASASESVKSDSLVSIKSRKEKLPQAGWAMKKLEKTSLMTERIKNEIREYFHRQRDARKRALAREISASLREMKLKNGEYTYELVDCPMESQCQTFISTLLKEEAKEMHAKESVKGNPRKKSKLALDQDDSEEDSDDNQPTCSKNNPPTDHKVKLRRTNSGRKKSLLKKEKQHIFDDDDVAEMMEEIDEADIFEE